MEATYFSEKPVDFQKTTRQYIPRNRTLQDTAKAQFSFLLKICPSEKCFRLKLQNSIRFVFYTMFHFTCMKRHKVFLIGIVGGGVQLGPIDTTATNRPIVPAPGEYGVGEIGGVMIGKGNRSTRRKPTPVLFCPPQTPHACSYTNLGRRGGKPATNHLNYGTAMS
jgi:hypothetical protein